MEIHFPPCFPSLVGIRELGCVQGAKKVFIFPPPQIIFVGREEEVVFGFAFDCE